MRHHQILFKSMCDYLRAFTMDESTLNIPYQINYLFLSLEPYIK